jgi:tetratricopeptide (TPR) repeat protein
MSRSFLSALAVAVVLGAGTLHGVPARAQAAPTPSVSQHFAKTFKAAQDAMNAKRWVEVISKAQEVLGAGNRKPDDTYYANYLLYRAYNAQGNNAESRKALQGLVDSGFLSPSQQAPFVKSLMAMAFQAKDYQDAIDHGLILTKGNNADSQVFTTIGQSYFLMNNFAESARFFKSLVNTQIERGQTPLESNLVMMQASYEKLGDKTGATDALEKLVVYYPSAKYWDALLFTVRGIPDLDNHQRLFLYRLMWATNTLKLAQDYSKFAELATGLGLHLEAQKVFEAGIKAGVFKDAERARADRLMRSEAALAEAGKANLAKLESRAASAPNGEPAVMLGMQRYAYGETDKAATALQQGIAKGGLKGNDAIAASLMLGMAQIRNKDKAAAQKTFAGIKTTDPNWQRIARFWGLYAK